MAVTRVSASLQGFSFLLSLICCDSMKALGLRKRLPSELYNVHFEIIFLQDFRPVSQQKCKATVRELIRSQQNTSFVNLASLSVFRPGFNMTFKLLSSCSCCTVLPVGTEGASTCHSSQGSLDSGSCPATSF